MEEHDETHSISTQCLLYQTERSSPPTESLQRHQATIRAWRSKHVREFPPDGPVRLVSAMSRVSQRDRWMTKVELIYASTKLLGLTITAAEAKLITIPDHAIRTPCE